MYTFTVINEHIITTQDQRKGMKLIHYLYLRKYLKL